MFELALALLSSGHYQTHVITGHKPPLEALPDRLRDNILGWPRLNRGLHLHYYTNAEQKHYLNTHCDAGPPRLCEIIPLLGINCRAEIFSYLRLFVEGGWWVDADTPSSNISRVCSPIQESDTMVLVKYGNENRPRHSMFAATPRHPIVYRVLQRIVNNTVNVKIRRIPRLPDSVLFVTGPHNLHEAICDLMPSEDRTRFCGSRLKKAPFRWEGENTHFGGSADTSTGRVYGSGRAQFRYISCDIPHHIGQYKLMIKKMGVPHHETTKS